MADLNQRDNAPKKKKSASPGIVIFFIIMLVSMLTEELPRSGNLFSRAPLLILFLAVGIITAVIIIIAVRASAKNAAARGMDKRPTQVHTPMRQSQPTRPYTKNNPDAYCLVCDQTGVDHFERDRQRRLNQIDYWLSIGLIERREYNQLRARYSSENYGRSAR